jgi:hypothetical protein
LNTILGKDGAAKEPPNCYGTISNFVRATLDLKFHVKMKEKKK